MKKFIPFLKSDPQVAIVRLQGAITNGGRGLDDTSLAPVLDKAFSKGKPAAVALEINCPGGSPVQSSLIAARIRRLADEKDIPVYAFVEDVAASGGYWLACAADEIHVDSCSIGQKGVDQGLVDGIGHLVPVMKDRFGDKVTFRRYGQKRGLLSRFGAQVVDDAIASVEDRAAFARFGL